MDSEDEDYTDTVTKLDKISTQISMDNQQRQQTKYKAKDMQRVFS